LKQNSGKSNIIMWMVVMIRITLIMMMMTSITDWKSSLLGYTSLRNSVAQFLCTLSSIQGGNDVTTLRENILELLQTVVIWALTVVRTKSFYFTIFLVIQLHCANSSLHVLLSIIDTTITRHTIYHTSEH